MKTKAKLARREKNGISVQGEALMHKDKKGNPRRGRRTELIAFGFCPSLI